MDKIIQLLEKLNSNIEKLLVNQSDELPTYTRKQTMKQTMKHKKYNIKLIKHEMRTPRWYDGLLRYAYAFHPLGCVLVMVMFIFIMAYTIFMWFTSPSLTGNY